MLRTAALIIIGVLLCAPTRAGTEDTLRVDTASAIRLALIDNPELQIGDASVAFAEARAAQARAARFLTTAQVTTAHALAPSLDVPADLVLPRDALYLDPRVRDDWASPRPYNQVEVELLQPLYTWGELAGQIRAAEAAIAIEQADADNSASGVALRTAELVEGLRAAEVLARLAAEAEDVLGRARDELDRLLDEGDPDVRDADVFQLQIFEQELRRQRVEVTERRALAASALARQLGRPSAVVAVPAQAPLAIDAAELEEVQARAVASRPELRQAAAGVEARAALVRVARSHYYPRLFAGASFTGRYAAGRERQPNPYIIDPYLGGGIRAGVGVRQDLAFGQTRARVQQAEAQLSEVRSQQEAVEQLVLFEVEEAFRNLIIARAALEARTEGASIAAEWLRVEQINFDLELGRVSDLVAAARADLEARLALAEAVRVYNVAALRLLARTGTLADSARDGTLFDN
jgi:outer membrane protein